jgi:heme/copper-type cytochrome/quinol oxidase subunit 2
MLLWTGSSRPRRIHAAAGLAAGLTLVAGIWATTAAQPADAPRLFTIHAHKYAYEPARVEVDQDDLVKVALKADDIPHSFTVDAYRISKRAGAGETVTFEFRADRPGTFPFYCDLRVDEGCRRMRGELVVRAR